MALEWANFYNKYNPRFRNVLGLEMGLNDYKKKILQIIPFLQLNEYETAPYFIQFSQNLTCDCLLISVFSPKFPRIYLS